MCDGEDSVIVPGRWKKRQSGVLSGCSCWALSSAYFVNSCLLVTQHAGWACHLLWIAHRPFCLRVWQPAKQIRWNGENTNGCMIIENDESQRVRESATEAQGAGVWLLCLMFTLLHLSFLSSFVSNSLCSANDHSKEGGRGRSQCRAVIKPCIIHEWSGTSARYVYARARVHWASATAKHMAEDEKTGHGREIGRCETV